MAIFTNVFVKLGDMWPVHYPAELPNGETVRLRLVRRVKRKDGKRRDPDDLLFVNTETGCLDVYAGEQFLDDVTADECCTIDYNGIPLLLEASRCELAYSELPWMERMRIIKEMQDNMTSFSNMLPKANREYINEAYDEDDVCEEYKEIARYVAAKIEDTENNDPSDSRISFSVPASLLTGTMFTGMRIYCYRKYPDAERTSNYMMLENEGAVSLSIDLYKLNEWTDYEDLEEYVVDELMNAARDYGWHLQGVLEERLEAMKELLTNLRL